MRLFGRRSLLGGGKASRAVVGGVCGVGGEGTGSRTGGLSGFLGDLDGGDLEKLQ